MILKDFIMVMGITSRTKAYLQNMVKNTYIPSICLVLAEDENELAKRDKFNSDLTFNEYFNINEPLLQTFKDNKINYKIIGSKDINSDIVKRELGKHSQKYIIYSGYGGYILKDHLFNIGKNFIHIHAGILPQYRGSTTAYYSMLMEKKIGASAIFMNAGIDTGDVIFAEQYDLPRDGVNIDYIYEPYIRSQVLIKTLEQYIANGKFLTVNQDVEKSETYYIIHPVLKHIALISHAQESGF